MIVEPVKVQERDGQTVRSARVAWSGTDLELWLRGPSHAIDATEDASGFLCITLPLAMWIGAHLTIEGPASPILVGRVAELQTVYRAWNREMASIGVQTNVPTPAIARVTTRSASLFSRGVDSMFTAATDGADVLVFGDRLDPRLDTDVRAEEIRRTRSAASCLGRPLVIVASNVRTLTDRFGTDWEDVLGAGLSFLAHGIAGGFGTVIVPSSDSYESIEPCGSSPLLDPLFSSERVTVVHGSITHTRLGKVRWLADRAPELLRFLKVCYAENRPDNCGQCGKCVYTMACLHAAGALGRASEFPSTIDPDLVRRLRLPHLKARIDWAELVDELPRTGADGDLRRAIVDVLRASTLSAQYQSLPGGKWVPRRWTRDQRLNLMLSLVLEGHPPDPLRTEHGDQRPLGLLRSRVHARPAYRLGSLAGHRDADELGTVLARPLPGAIPVWFTVDGLLLTRGMAAHPAAPLHRRLGWAIAPLFSNRLLGGPWAALRRLRSLRTTRRTASPDEASCSTAGNPSAYLHQQDGPGRVPLYVSWHPVLGDQFLSTQHDEGEYAGYGAPTLLGYLEMPESE